MNQKNIGYIVLLAGLLLFSFTYLANAREERYIQSIIDEKGSCFLDDGTCLHADGKGLFIFGWIITFGVIILGVYLLFFDKTQAVLAEHQIKITQALNKAKIQETKRDEFQAFLAGFSTDEQKILKAVHDQEGIKQSTLRYRTGMSKTSLSLLLKTLEEREIVSKKPSGKTNEVYLIKKF